MRVIAITILLFGALEAGSIRSKRQTNYQFPGPRSQAGPAYRPQDDSSLYQSPRRQFQAQPVQQYSPQPTQNTQYNPRASSSYGGGAATQRQPSGGTQYRPDGYGDAAGAEQEPSTPDPLSVLLQDSKFSCSGKTDGYYSDNSVNCQAFHYCVGGAKHSWMCPSGTVFHQVHLNCVPSSQDICNNAEKFYFVNDYLHKPLEQRGPNNTVVYAQRYYPEGYVLGDTLLPPGGNQQGSGYQQGSGGGYQSGGSSGGSGYGGGSSGGSSYGGGSSGGSSYGGGSPQGQPAYRPPASQPSPYQPPATSYQPPATSYQSPSSSYRPAAPSYQAARQPSISQPSSPAYRPPQPTPARAPAQSYGPAANNQPFAGLPDLTNFGANIPGFRPQVGGGAAPGPGGPQGYSPQQLGLGLPPGGQAAGRPGYGGAGGVRYDDEYYN